MADDQIGSDQYVERELTRRIMELERHLSADVITCIMPIHQPLDDVIRDAIEDIKSRKNKLFVLLETEGGSIEAAERIANVFRHHTRSLHRLLRLSHDKATGRTAEKKSKSKT